MANENPLTARRDQIMKLLRDQGTVRSDELGERLGVSTMTVHRDLDALAELGWVRRFHGGAAIERTVLFELNVESRVKENTAAKQVIAKAVVDLVSPGNVVMCDDSTTSLAAVQALLNASMPLTFITNFRRAAEAVVDSSTYDLVLIGGNYNRSYDSFSGPVAESSISELSADLSLLSTSAVVDGNCFHQLADAIAVKRAMINAAQRSVLLVDNSKFERRALHRLCSVFDFDYIIVDSETSPSVIAGLEDSGTQVIVAGK